MNTYALSSLAPDQRARLLLRPSGTDSTTRAAVERIVRDVREGGDAALREYTLQFDRAKLKDFRVSPNEFQDAVKRLPPSLRSAIDTAARNIRTFHAAQVRSEPVVMTSEGVSCWRETRPIRRVGLYVPAGSAPLPSTVLMLGIPAVLAGCPDIILCSPPRVDGSVDPTVLAACSVVGIERVFKLGGAQAIAAMAYGTVSIPKVDKVFGPGNRFVAAAKLLVASDPRGAAIDLPAGPSELLVIADETAQPAWVIADLLSQAEHDPDAQVVLVTTSKALADRVENDILQVQETLPRASIIADALKHSFIILADTLAQAVGFANDYAPEHLMINTRDPGKLVRDVRHAGSVFLGPYAPVTAGDYASGTNHTLPTGGSARSSSGLSLESFQTSITFQSITCDGLLGLAPVLSTLASAEGLEAHRRAVNIREELP